MANPPTYPDEVWADDCVMRLGLAPEAAATFLDKCRTHNPGVEAEVLVPVLEALDLAALPALGAWL